MKIYTDKTTSVDVQVSEGNKWYTYLLPKDKGLYNIEGDSVKKVVVKADISHEGTSSYRNPTIIPKTTIEASFKGSNTSNVTNMKGMFYQCSGLTSLDVGSFDTSNVIYMWHMFYNCSGLKSLDVSRFDTSKVTDMNYMFGNCSGLTSLDVSNFDTSKVTDMGTMFTYCSNLTSLDVSNFDTSKVTNMGSMFYGCSNITSLDLSGWDMRSVTTSNDMFYNCDALKTIKMVRCSEATINKIKALKPSTATIVTE